MTESIMKNIRVLEIQHDSLSNGNGLRTVLYIAGCSHYCKGCHNPTSWNLLNGQLYTCEELLKEINSNSIADVTISGGDPLTFQFHETLFLCKLIKERTSKSIWLYSGFTFEEIFQLNKEQIFNYVDVLVDGPFIENQKDYRLHFRGSRNQRIINIPETLKQEKIIELNY